MDYELVNGKLDLKIWTKMVYGYLVLECGYGLDEWAKWRMD